METPIWRAHEVLLASEIWEIMVDVVVVAIAIVVAGARVEDSVQTPENHLALFILRASAKMVTYVASRI
jgi:hypothetical protein